MASLSTVPAYLLLEVTLLCQFVGKDWGLGPGDWRERLET